MFAASVDSQVPRESNLPSAKHLQSAQLVLSEAARPAGAAAPAASASAAASLHMMNLIVDTVESHRDATQLALVLAQRGRTAPERNVFTLWYRMLGDSRDAPAMRAEAVGLDAVPAVRRWFVGHATHVQHLLCRCPRLRRMAVALKWLEDTFEPPAVAEIAMPYAAAMADGSAGPRRDPDLEHKIFLQLRGGCWDRACALAEEGAAQIAHIVRASLMPAASAQRAAWLEQMPRAQLFGEYEALNAAGAGASAAVAVADKRQNTHRLPLLLRMWEHLGSDASKAAAATAASSAGDFPPGGRPAAGSAAAPTSSVGLDGAAAVTSPAAAAAALSSSSSAADYFAGIAALLCGDEAAMKAACRLHFGSTAASVLQHQYRRAAAGSAAGGASSAPPLSWQDELWALLRSSLVAAINIAIVRGSTAGDSGGTPLEDLFGSACGSGSIAGFVSALETRCGLSGGQEHAALDDGATDWYHLMEQNLGNSVVARLRGLSSRLPADSADGAALQTLTLFLTDAAQGHISPQLFPCLVNAVSPALAPPASGATGPFVPWTLPEQASLCQLVSLACQQSLCPAGANPQSEPIFAEIVCAMLTECLCNPSFDVHYIIPNMGRVALYSSLTLEQPRRVMTHTATLRAMRVRFFGDVGRFVQLETNSAEGHTAMRMRETDAQLHGGNVNAVDLALKGAAQRFREDGGVPMLTHDVRCEQLLWRSFMSPRFLGTVLTEAVGTLRELWHDGRNIAAIRDVCAIWEKRLRRAVEEAIEGGGIGMPSASGLGSPSKGMSPANSTSSSAMHPSGASAPNLLSATASGAGLGASSPTSPTAVSVLRFSREQIIFWQHVLSCHDLHRAAFDIVAQLLQPSSADALAGRRGAQQQQLLLPSRRHDLCVALRRLLMGDFADAFDLAARMCPKNGGTAAAACLELLAEAAAAAMPQLDDVSLPPLLEAVFGKLLQLERTHCLGVSPATPQPPGAVGVELLPTENAAALMRRMQALRAAYVAEQQRRKAQQQLA
jgi:hypothetical protein